MTPPESIIQNDPIIQTITPTSHNLGDFRVHRSLPAKERTMVGPFIFFDQAGPARIAPGQGVDVRPHPHINLATVTYMYEGSFLHRDSLGTEQLIEPRSEEHTSELQSLMRISYAVFCLKKNKTKLHRN